MGRMRAAIRASAKARSNNRKPKTQTCWGGLQGADCTAPCGDRVDADGYPACEEHGGHIYLQEEA